MSGHAQQVIYRVAFAPADRGWRYPLAIAAALDWQRRRGAWTAEATLPHLPAAHLVVPSFAAVGSPDWHCELIAGGERILAAGVGRRAAQTAPPAQSRAPAAAQVDCFVTRAELAHPRVRFCVAGAAPPQDYLAVVGARPATLPPPVAPPARVPARTVPAKTQMRAAARLRSRICSPTCVSMALDYLGVAHDFDELLTAAFHRPTNLFGVWPQNLWAASRCGALGAVETATDWQAPSAALAAGHPVAASIAFAQGALPGSPLPGSAGHLVIVRGIENNRVFANDPAASDEASVPRSYDSRQFAAAWLAKRGAFYLFASNGR